MEQAEKSNSVDEITVPLSELEEYLASSQWEQVKATVVEHQAKFTKVLDDAMAEMLSSPQFAVGQINVNEAIIFLAFRRAMVSKLNDKRTAIANFIDVRMHNEKKPMMENKT